MSKVQYFLTNLVIDEGEPNMPNTCCIRVVLAKSFDEALAREASLREELAALRESYEAMRDRKNSIVYLQQRLTFADQRTDEMERLLRGALRHVPHYGKSDWQGSLRHKINEALKPAAEGEGS